MTTLLFLFFLIALALAFFKRKKTANYLFAFTILLFVFIGCGIFSEILLPKLQSVKMKNSSWGKRNAIVLLGGGAVSLPNEEHKPSILAYSRIHETAKKYLSCKKSANLCQIIISGGDAGKTGKSEAVIYQKELSELGIDKKDILLEDHSLNTYKNAEFTSEILQKNSYDNICLVTSSLHMKRALIYFKHFGVNPNPFVADYISPIKTIIPIGYNFVIADLIAHEYLGIMRLYVYNFFGWNKTPNKAKLP